MDSTVSERSRLSGRQATPTHKSPRSATVRLRSRTVAFRCESGSCRRLVAQASSHFRHKPRPHHLRPPTSVCRPAPPKVTSSPAHFCLAPRPIPAEPSARLLPAGAPPLQGRCCQSVYDPDAAKRWSAAVRAACFPDPGAAGGEVCFRRGRLLVGGELFVLTLYPRLTWNSRASSCLLLPAGVKPGSVRGFLPRFCAPGQAIPRESGEEMAPACDWVKPSALSGSLRQLHTRVESDLN